MLLLLLLLLLLTLIRFDSAVARSFAFSRRIGVVAA